MDKTLENVKWSEGPPHFLMLSISSNDLKASFYCFEKLNATFCKTSHFFTLALLTLADRKTLVDCVQTYVYDPQVT